MKPPLEVLLVEDNEGDVEMTERALRDGSPSCNLSVAVDGQEALDYLSKRAQFQNAITPHLILLDINMPRMNGKEFLRVIKQDEQMKTIPVVMLTSSKAPADILESYALHASCYVVKPFDGKDFMDVVRQVVNFWRTLIVLPHEAGSLA